MVDDTAWRLTRNTVGYYLLFTVVGTVCEVMLAIGINEMVMKITGIEEKIQIPQKEKSLGMRNVNERIAMIFGKGARLFFRKDEEGHTIAEILIPADCVLHWKL